MTQDDSFSDAPDDKYEDHTVEVMIHAELPNGLVLEQFLKALRTFDSYHPGCHFNIRAVGADDVKDLKAMMERVGFPFISVIRKH